MTSQESQDILDVRKKMWDKFFIKYEKSSRSSVDYSLSEIDNFLGESAISLSKSTNTDKSKIGPLSPLACNTMKKNFEYLKSLENHVENVLKSNLKDVLHKRGECKILESDEFDLWHQRAKQEIRNLKKHITKTQVEHYMTSITSFNKVSVKKFIDDLDTDLKKLLTKREFLRNDEKKYLKNRTKLCEEWKELTDVIPVEYLIFYAYEVISSVRMQKSLTTKQELTKENVQYA